MKKYTLFIAIIINMVAAFVIGFLLDFTWWSSLPAVIIPFMCYATGLWVSFVNISETLNDKTNNDHPQTKNNN